MSYRLLQNFYVVLHCEGNIVGRGAQKSGKLVTTPVVSYNKLIGKTGDLTMDTQKSKHKRALMSSS